MLVPARLEHTFNGDGRVRSETRKDPADLVADAVTEYAYDSSSNLKQVKDPLGQTLDSTYDSLGRLVEIAVGDVQGGTAYRKTYGSFDDLGLPQLETEHVPSATGNPDTYSRTFDYDVYGRRTAVIDGLGQRFETVYDPRGNVVRQIQPGGFTSTYAYDGLDRPTREARPEGIMVDHVYTETVDASGRRYKDALNQETIYAYDGLGRLTSVTYPD